MLFCDLVGSTALGESADPEVVRARMRRYFEDLRVILERHGGTVEKFVGDAVMAVFGIPTAHEDDALRAVRAAWEMREAIAEHELEARIGINTGEVVVGGEGETLVTGDAVNVAARLEQSAPDGEVLIGAETRLLVRDAVVVEPLAPLELKGKSAPVDAYRLVDVVGDALPIARNLTATLVGRERERQRLWRAFEDAVADRTCQLFTLLGPAGIGKSRLVADFLERVGGAADVLRGRCLSYGEGITYWPLVEMLVPLGIDPESVVASMPEETRVAFRRLLESSRRRAAAGGGDRRSPVGRAGVRRSRRARRRPLAQRADLLPLRRAHRAARRPTRLGWREAERDVAPARAAEPGRMRRPHREPARRNRAGRGHARSHRGGVGRERALRRGDGGDAPRASGRWRSRRAAVDPRTAPGTPGPPRRRGAARHRARVGRGAGVPSRRGRRAGASDHASCARGAALEPRSQGADPARVVTSPRRRRVHASVIC